MSDSSSGGGGGIGVLGLLGVAFVVLKLCDVIDWSWWWVTALFWGGLALVLAIFILFGGLAAIFAGFAALFDRKSKPRRLRSGRRI